MGKEKVTNEDFFHKLLDLQEITEKQKEYIDSVKKDVGEVLQKKTIAPYKLFYGGSLEKGTYLREKSDLDFIINYSPNINLQISELYSRLGELLKKKWRKIEKKYLGWHLNLKKGFDINIIPGIKSKEDNFGYYFHSTSNIVIETNFKAQIEYIKSNKRENVIRIMKLWALRREVPINDYLLEIISISACKGLNRINLENQVIKTFKFINDKIFSIKLNDPVNPNNSITEHLDQKTLNVIKTLAEEALNSKTWNKVFKK